MPQLGVPSRRSGRSVLRSWCRTMKTLRSRNVAVGRTKKSIDARAFAWLRRNVRHVCDGGFGRRVMSLETVASEILTPSFMSSPWTRGAPRQRVLTAHAADEGADIAWDRWASASAPPRFPRPVHSEAFSISADDGFRRHDHQHFTPIRQEPRSEHPEQAIRRPRRRPPGGSLHRGELMPNSNELKLERCAPTESVAERRKEEKKEDRVNAEDGIQSRSEKPRFLRPMGFLGGTGVHTITLTGGSYSLASYTKEHCQAPTSASIHGPGRCGTPIYGSARP